MGTRMEMETLESEVQMSYKIVHNEKGDHYDGYIDGKFFCSGDKYSEVAKEIDDYLSERR